MALFWMCRSGARVAPLISNRRRSLIQTRSFTCCFGSPSRDGHCVRMRIRVSLETTVARATAGIGDTYELSGFKVTYPGNIVSQEESADGIANVAFDAAWSGETFPGDAWCQITVADASGNTVGDLHFIASYPRPAEVGPPPMAVAVNGEAATATGSCEAGVMEAGPGYDFGTPTVAGAEGREGSVATFTSEWVSGRDPGTRECEVSTVSRSGESTTEVSLIAVADDAKIDVLSDLAPSEIASVSITCHEVRA